MSKEEIYKKVKEIYENSEIKTVTFSSYYKYTFYFDGENENIRLYLGHGGDSDEIYRFDVNREPVLVAPDIDLLAEDYHYIRLTDKKTGIEYSTYHFWEKPNWEIVEQPTKNSGGEDNNNAK